MIKGIIFDIGGILVPEDDGKILKAVAKRLKVKESVIENLRHECFEGLTCGQLTLLEFYDLVVRRLNIPIKGVEVLATHMKEYEKIAKADPRVVDLIEELKLSYRVVCMSNTEREMAALNKKLGIYDVFHKAYLSTQMHLAKPSAESFGFVLSDMGLMPNEAVFLDDRPQNVHAAADLSMNAILVEGGFGRMKADLMGLLRSKS